MVPATRTSKSQLYHYFADKDALVLEVIRRQLDQVIAGQETELRELRTWEGPRRWRDHVVEGTRMTGGVGGCPLGWPSTWPSPTPGATAPADSLVTAARAPGSERATAAGRGLKVSRAGSGGFLDLAGSVAMVPGFVEDLDRGGGRNGSRCAA